MKAMQFLTAYSRSAKVVTNLQAEPYPSDQLPVHPDGELIFRRSLSSLFQISILNDLEEF